MNIYRNGNVITKYIVKIKCTLKHHYLKYIEWKWKLNKTLN